MIWIFMGLERCTYQFHTHIVAGGHYLEGIAGLYGHMIIIELEMARTDLNFSPASLTALANAP